MNNKTRNFNVSPNVIEKHSKHFVRRNCLKGYYEQHSVLTWIKILQCCRINYLKMTQIDFLDFFFQDVSQLQCTRDTWKQRQISTLFKNGETWQIMTRSNAYFPSLKLGWSNLEWIIIHRLQILPKTFLIPVFFLLLRHLNIIWN